MVKVAKKNNNDNNDKYFETTGYVLTMNVESVGVGLLSSFLKDFNFINSKLLRNYVLHLTMMTA
jgi:hypothetical protein